MGPRTVAVNTGVVCRIFRISGSVGQKSEQFFERPLKILLKKNLKNIFYFFIFSEIALVVASVDKTGIPKIVLSPPKEYYTLRGQHGKIVCWGNVSVLISYP